MRAAPDTSHEPAGGTERSLTTAGVLAFASALGFVIYQLAVQTSYTTLRDSIEAELAISLVQSGIASSIFLLVYALMQIPAGLILDRVGPTPLLPIAVLATGASAWLFAESATLGMLVASRAMIGFAAAFAFPAVGLVGRRWLPPWCFALAMGGAEAAIGLGGTAGTFGAAHLEATIGWRAAATWFAAGALPFAVMAAVFIRRAPSGSAARAEAAPDSIGRAFLSVVSNRVVLLSAAVYAGACGMLFGLGSFWNTPLATAWEWGPEQASWINAAIFIGFGAGAPFFGWLGPRIGEVRTMTWSFLVAAATMVVWVLVPIDLGLAFDVVNVAIMGFACASSVLAFTLACGAVPAARTAAAVGMVNFAGIAAGAILQVLPGILVPSAEGGSLREQQEACFIFILAVLGSALAAWRIGRGRTSRLA